MRARRWYQAEIQWAVMVEGKQGLRAWEESVYFFQSEDRDAAFQKALEIGRRDRHLHGHQEDRLVETRLARIVSLAELGPDRTEFEVYLGSRRAAEHLPFKHEFDPAGTAPMDVF
ncbi:MAG TPA: DUF4288 domain-containing protein [Bryobacteraceae bacterium]|nr:DUF4288 domain-containing protein [Bryobacteraceae bacterium]